MPSDSAFDEATHLTFKDVSVDRLDNPTILKVRSKVSKTDPFRVGVEVCVGRSGCAPVSSVGNAGLLSDQGSWARSAVSNLQMGNP